MSTPVADAPVSSVEQKEDSHLQPVSVSDQKPNRPDTLRVKHIPTDCDAVTLEAELTRLFQSDAKLHSLEPSYDGYLCATVTFPKEEPKFASNSCTNLAGGPYKLVYDTQFIGITPLFDGRHEAEVDIIAVHGLGTHAFGTFRSPENQEMWLRDFLKDDIPKSRVLLYGYKSKVDNSTDSQSLKDLAKSFLRSIIHFRKYTKTEDRPIIFLAQCQGGLIVQELLVIAEDKEKDTIDHERKIFDSWCGLIGFGIPTVGLKNDGLRDAVEGQPNQRSINQYILDENGLSSPYLEAIRQAFDRCHKGKSVDILYYEETLEPIQLRVKKSSPSPEKGIYSVRRRDAPLRNSRILPMPTDHSKMVKFKSRNDPNYENVRDEIKTIVRDAMNIKSKPQEFDMRPFSACLSSLAFQEMDRRRTEISEGASGTCQWLLTNQVYTTWLDKRQGLLWIMGNPGTGKSTLVKYALTSALETNRESQDMTVIASFFFHGRGTDLQKTAVGLYRSLLHQILVQVPELLAEFNSKWQKERDTKSKPGEAWIWEESDLKKRLGEAIAQVSKTKQVQLYVDALDEAGEEVARVLVMFFRRIVESDAATSNALSICFSCRHYPLVRPDQCFEIITVERKNGEDILSFIHGRLAMEIQDESKIKALASALNKSAGNVFQWVVLVISDVVSLHYKGANTKRIEQKIKETPTDLSELYKKLLESIEKDDKSQSLRLMQWVYFALHPLSLAELRFALAVEADCPFTSIKKLSEESLVYVPTDGDFERRIKHLSGGLVEVNAYQPGKAQSHGQFVVQFIHQTCLKYIAMEEVFLNCDFGIFEWGYQRQKFKSQQMARLKQTFPFLQYAVNKWISHAKLVENEGICQKDLINLLHPPSNRTLKTWIHYYETLAHGDAFFHDLFPDTSLLHVAVRYDLQSVLLAYFDSRQSRGDFTVESQDKKSRTPLYMAVERGQEAMVQLLLKNGVDTNAQGGYDGSALQAASHKGFVAIVRLLLKNGVDVNAKDKFSGNALAAASGAGHKAIVQLLLENGADINAQGGHFGNALQAASCGTSIAILQLLLEKGADINAQGGYFGNALQAASCGGFIAIVQLLLENGANVNAQGGHMGNALQAASVERHDDIVQLLLKNGAKW